MNRIVELLRASLLRQATAHGASVTAQQAVGIAGNLAVVLLVDAECPDCRGSLAYRGEREVVCDACGRVAFQFSGEETKQPVDRS